MAGNVIIMTSWDTGGGRTQYLESQCEDITSGQQGQGVGYIPLKVRKTLSGTHVQSPDDDYFIRETCLWMMQRNRSIKLWAPEHQSGQQWCQPVLETEAFNCTYL